MRSGLGDDARFHRPNPSLLPLGEGNPGLNPASVSGEGEKGSREEKNVGKSSVRPRKQSELVFPLTPAALARRGRIFGDRVGRLGPVLNDYPGAIEFGKGESGKVFVVGESLVAKQADGDGFAQFEGFDGVGAPMNASNVAADGDVGG